MLLLLLLLMVTGPYKRALQELPPQGIGEQEASKGVHSIFLQSRLQRLIVPSTGTSG